jgi:hypothetical protein
MRSSGSGFRLIDHGENQRRLQAYSVGDHLLNIKWHEGVK